MFFTLTSVRAVINLEAAGTSGRELLFQATSEQMIQAYAHVPRPFGSSLANDIFRSGFILSEYVQLEVTLVRVVSEGLYSLVPIFDSLNSI